MSASIPQYFQNAEGNNIPRERSNKRPTACNYCREKKIRCNGGQPCANCRDHGEECITPTRKRQVRTKRNDNSTVLEKRLAHVESLLQAATILTAGGRSNACDDVTETGTKSRSSPSPPSTQIVSPNSGAYALQPEPVEGENQSSNKLYVDSNAQEVMPGDGDFFDHISSAGRGILSPSPSVHRHYSITQKPTEIDMISQTLPSTETLHHQTRCSSSISLSVLSQTISSTATDVSTSTPIDKQERASVFSAENTEYHGPRSYLSICSKPAIQWVNERTGCSSFEKIAGRLTSNITRNLKMNQFIPRERAPEPDADIAWCFTEAYFEQATDAALGIVHRPWFEARLRAHYDGNQFDNDLSWYALRHTILASGCRLVLGRTSGFKEASMVSWRYFENALAVHTDLLYFKTGLVAVQALTLMTYFVEGLGSPSLEYMLFSSAMRLAVSKGLHRQPSSTWNMTIEEISHRNWIFWALYCFEKQLNFRSGRPSIIDDDEISTQIPTTTSHGSMVNLVYCTTLIQSAQLASKVAKRLSSAKVFWRSPEEVLDMVTNLDKHLQQLKALIGGIFNLDQAIDPSDVPLGISVNQALHIYFVYYGILSDIHSVFTYPWFKEMLALHQGAAFQNQRMISAQNVAKASRAILLATQYIPTTASSPVSIVFFYPMYSLINLFIHILQSPRSHSASSDVSLLSIGAGHFARLEFSSDSEMAFPFPREVADLARVAMKRAKSANGTGVIDQFESYEEATKDPNAGYAGIRGTIDQAFSAPGSGMGIGATCFDGSNCGEEGGQFMGTVDDADFDMDSWSTMLNQDLILGFSPM